MNWRARYHYYCEELFNITSDHRRTTTTQVPCTRWHGKTSISKRFPNKNLKTGNEY